MAGVHYSNKLEDQAAATALNSHKQERRPSVLDEDGKLSSASAAMSLKYAQAQDLPSFPSAGLKLSSAGAAASIADSNKRNFEHWKPGNIPAANRAALLAKDYEMDPLWQPEMSAAGSKAALLAHKDTTSPTIWKSQGSEEGQSAAGQALKSKPPNAITERNVSAEGHRKAMLAATGAMSGNRPRSGSTPVSKGETTNWALKAATTSHKGVPNSGPFASGDPGFEAARVQNMAKNNVNRQLYGSNPPVSIEIEEKNRQDTLRASAVAMAKQMYALQQSQGGDVSGGRPSESTTAATRSHRRNLSDNSIGDDDSVTGPTPRYENLEEAARKLAQERLAKMRDEHAEYRQYYGAGKTSTRSRLSMSLRRRASFGGRQEDSSDDEEQSRRIRTQMSLFQTKVNDVDNKKRQADRDALLVAAHRNVEARMAQLDEKVFQDTGKASPAQRDLWEKQAREKAQKASDERMVNVGKVHIGGGKYLDQAEVDAIARARLQPTLDEINDTAERQRARDAEIRADHERAQEQLKKEKAREAEVKAELKAAERQEKLEKQRKKDEEKLANREKAAAEKEARKAEESAEKERIKKEKDERQAIAAEEKERARLEKEEKRKSAEGTPGKLNSTLKSKTKESSPAETEESEPTTAAANEGNTVHDQVTMPTYEDTEQTRIITTQHERSVPETSTADETLASPTKRESKVKSWFKSLTGSNKTTKDEADGVVVPAVYGDTEQTRDESIREVAMAGRETDDLYGTASKEEQPVSPIHDTEEVKRSRSSSISSYSEQEAVIEEARPLSGAEHTAQVGRTGLKAKLMKKIKSNKDEDTGEPARQSFVTATTTDDDDEQDNFEEAKDKVEDDKLVLPPTISNSKVPISPRSSHEHSKFKEEL